MDIYAAALAEHERLRGKIGICVKRDIADAAALSLMYTPGVAEPCRAIAADKDAAYAYTMKGGAVAVVTDGTAVLGLGDIGATAAIPVMEGKAALFKAFADIDAFPICLDTTDDDEIVRTVTHIAPVFGGINLEDIAAPRCFEIERRLKAALDIPVFHDDQHGTAIVVAAALSNALKVVGKGLGDVCIAVNGLGAAGAAITKLLAALGARHFRLCDRAGCFFDGRVEGAETFETEILPLKNQRTLCDLSAALAGADVFVGVSAANLVTADMARRMNPGAVIFAMANPTPEIMPESAREAGAAVICTGRSDYPNQVNNVLAFPGVFRGALDCRASDINEPMKIAAARALAALVPARELRADYVIPAPFDGRVAAAVAAAVALAARASGVARV